MNDSIPPQTLQIPLDKLPPLEPNQLFELTLEGRGGSPTGKPTGPMLYTDNIQRMY